MSPDASGSDATLKKQDAATTLPSGEPTTSEKLDMLLNQNPLPGWRLVAWPVMILLGVGVLWANFATLDEVSIATGEVVPAGRIKVVQHLEGGIIQEIYVSEGDTVREGQTLMQLDLAGSGTNREELLVRLDSERLIKPAWLQKQTVQSLFSLKKSQRGARQSYPPNARPSKHAVESCLPRCK